MKYWEIVKEMKLCYLYVVGIVDGGFYGDNFVFGN